MRILLMVMAIGISMGFAQFGGYDCGLPVLSILARSVTNSRGLYVIVLARGWTGIVVLGVDAGQSVSSLNTQHQCHGGNETLGCIFGGDEMKWMSSKGKHNE